MNIPKIKSLNDICRDNRFGLYKQWIYKKEDYIKMCDYMQKISYSIQDLNSTIKELENFDRKNIVYIISLVDWIREALNAIVSVINPKVISHFSFSKQDELKQHNDYFKAIRSFVVAHPLATTNHSKFGLDGDFICIDIRDYEHLFIFKRNGNREYSISIDGLKNGIISNGDFYLLSYSKKYYSMQYYTIIGCNYCDIYNTASLYVEKLYALDKYLVKNVKKKDYE